MNVAASLQDIREEFRLDENTFEHVSFSLTKGMLSPEDLRSMLSRNAVGSLFDRHGANINEWPSLRAVEPPPPRQKKAPPPMPGPSHRGIGAFAPMGSESRSPSVVVTDWNHRGRRRTPAPEQRRRAATSSPSGRTTVVKDVMAYLSKKPGGREGHMSTRT